MYILGINSYHPDSSACIIKDGVLISAVEEERFRRIKHWAGFPTLSISHCLKEVNIKLSDVKYISINRNSRANIYRKLLHIIKYRPDLKLILDRLKRKKKWHSVTQMLSKEFPDQKFLGKVIQVEHHIAHLSSAFYVSPFKNSCVVSVDGFGDFASTAWGYADNNKILLDDKIYFPHSLGAFYESMTQFLGFNKYGDEYKVMGLAPYGKPSFLDKLRKILIQKENGTYELNLDYYIFHKSYQNYEWENGEVKSFHLFSKKINQLLGNPRNKGEDITQFHKDLAYSTQAIYEETFFNLLNKIYQKYQNKNICIAGGCGMNSVANGKITKFTPFKNIYIHPAAGDAGGAIGAAYYTWHKILKKEKKFVMKHASWGNSYSNDYIKLILDSEKNKLKDQNCNINYFDDYKTLNENVAKDLSNGKIIGWFQGRMEWGPRALGNRSILADPRRADMKDILNIKIKRRESFRPFAPSIMREYVSDWFETEDEVPFMMKVFQIKNEKRKIIPAVTHVDGSGRLQTVYEDINERYYDLIKNFYKITKVPLILNTSFNENEPIICKPEEAIDCFLRTKMDILVLENFVIRRDYIETI